MQVFQSSSWKFLLLLPPLDLIPLLLFFGLAGASYSFSWTGAAGSGAAAAAAGSSPSAFFSTVSAAFLVISCAFSVSLPRSATFLTMAASAFSAGDFSYTLIGSATGAETGLESADLAGAGYAYGFYSTFSDFSVFSAYFSYFFCFFYSLSFFSSFSTFLPIPVAAALSLSMRPCRAFSSSAFS